METTPSPGRDETGSADETQEGTGITLAGEAEPSPRTEPTLGTGSTIGRYTVVSRLGAGGMGVVYLAYDPELDRQVALKLLHPGSSRGKPHARARLLREAQSLAKLSHPNVVSVFDAGEHEGEVWLAMERIEGRTLTEWCAATLPRWPELLRVLADAARGVAAAHAAGLVHRDLKPSNLMVADDGRVRVMDFGLARLGDDESSHGSDDVSPVSELRSSPKVQSLTRTHDVLGTPAYMAPEQWQAGAIDARADQFSWCVMAWEALYGRRPYGEEPTATFFCERLDVPSHRTPAGHVPKWVRRMLERGLRHSPDERWPDMTDLLGVVDRRTSRRRQQRVTLVLSGILVAGLIGGGVWQIDREHRQQECRDAGAEIESLWPGRQAEISEVFASSDVAYVRRLESSLAPRIGTWAEDWSDIRSEVCEAATIEESIDAAHRARVEVCLHAQRMAITMLLDLVARGDPMALRRAPFMTSTFPAVGQCRDPQVLEALPIPKLGELGTMREGPERWIQAMTLQDAGRYEEALVEVEAVLEMAKTRDWDPLKIQAGLLVGTLQVQLGRYREGADALRRIYFQAGGAGMESAAVLAAARLVEVEGVKLARSQQGLMWAEHARMMMRRLGDDSAQHELLLLENESEVARVEGNYDRAEDLLGRVIEQRRQTQGDDHPEVALALRDLAAIHLARGDHRKAAALDRRVLGMLEASLGHDHPEVAKTLFMLAEARVEEDGVEGRALHERSLRVLEVALGAEHPELARSLHALAVLDAREGHHRLALERHQKALALRERTLPADHPELADSFGELAKFHRERRRYAQANELYGRAIEVVERTLGNEHPKRAKLISSLATSQRDGGAWEESEASFENALALMVKAPGGDRMQVAVTTNNFAGLMLERGRIDRAASLFERARVLMSRNAGPTHPVMGHPICGLAEVALRRGDAATAVTRAEQALALLAPRREVSVRADCRFIAAKARWMQQEGDPEALSLATQAVEDYRLLGDTSKRDEVMAWLAEREDEVRSEGESVEAPRQAPAP